MRTALSTLLAAVTASTAIAQTDPAAAPAIIKGPYLQHMLQDAVTIMWETDAPANSTVHYSVGGQWHAASDPSAVLIHEVRLSGMQASDTVRYYIETANGGGSSQSSQAVFTMAPALGSPFRLCVWGDNQQRPEVFAQHVARMIDDQPDLLLGCGDLVNTGSDYNEWNDVFLGPLRPLIKHTPMITAIGNHEGDSHWYYDFLAQPGNEHWYSYQYGNAFFLILDTNYPFAVGSEQYEYAYDALLSDEAQDATWLIVAHHHPGYSEIYEEGIYAQIRRELIPLYESAGVDVNFHGHIHDYERGEFVPPDTDRRIWQVQTSGAGGTLWSDEFDGEWDQIDLVILDQFHYCVVDLTETQMTLRAIGLAGQVLDEFTIPAAPRDGGPPDDGGQTGPEPSQWDFEGAGLAASYGPGVMEFFDGPSGPTAQQTVFGSTVELGLPPIAGEAARVMGFPKATASTMGFRVRHGTEPNGGGVYVNEYTLVFDMYIPGSGDSWLPFYNTTAQNANDADCWVRLSDGGVGVSGVYEGSVPRNAWARVALVFAYEGGSVKLHKYIDGSPVGTQDLGGIDGRWSLYSEYDGTPWFFLFTDDDGEASGAFVSSVHYTDRAMSAGEIAELGGPDADGVLHDPSCVADWNRDGQANTQDFLAYLNDWAIGEPGADLNSDGVVNTQDFLAFLNLWSAGC
jgi:hypothetical protein